MTRCDSAILDALGLDPSSVHLESRGSGFSSTFKLTGVPTGSEVTRSFFVKTGSGQDAEAMFRGR